MSHKKDTRLKWVKIKMKFEPKTSYIPFIFIMFLTNITSIENCADVNSLDVNNLATDGLSIDYY